MLIGVYQIMDRKILFTFLVIQLEKNLRAHLRAVRYVAPVSCPKSNLAKYSSYISSHFQSGK